MSLTTTSLVEAVRNQYFYKLKANIDSFSSLVGIQILAMLFSFGGVGSSGFGGEDISVNIKYYSSDMVFVFTMIWAFITAITITTKPYRNYDFTFVTNRLSSGLANVLFLGSAGLLGAITSVMSGNLLQVISALFMDEQLYHLSGGSSHYILGIFSTFFYLLLISSIGYFIGTLVQFSKVFVVIIPGLFIGTLFFQALALQEKEPFLWSLIQFYTTETTVSLFILKAVLTTLAFFALATSVLNRLEVKR